MRSQLNLHHGGFCGHVGKDRHLRLSMGMSCDRLREERFMELRLKAPRRKERTAGGPVACAVVRGTVMTAALNDQEGAALRADAALSPVVTKAGLA